MVETSPLQDITRPMKIVEDTCPSARLSIAEHPAIAVNLDGRNASTGPGVEFIT